MGFSFGFCCDFADFDFRLFTVSTGLQAREREYEVSWVGPVSCFVTEVW